MPIRKDRDGIRKMAVISITALGSPPKPKSVDELTHTLDPSMAVMEDRFYRDFGVENARTAQHQFLLGVGKDIECYIPVPEIMGRRLDLEKREQVGTYTGGQNCAAGLARCIEAILEMANEPLAILWAGPPWHGPGAGDVFWMIKQIGELIPSKVILLFLILDWTSVPALSDGVQLRIHNTHGQILPPLDPSWVTLGAAKEVIDDLLGQAYIPFSLSEIQDGRSDKIDWTNHAVAATTMRAKAFVDKGPAGPILSRLLVPTNKKRTNRRKRYRLVPCVARLLGVQPDSTSFTNC